MPSTNTNTNTSTDTILFPGALGDFLCLWPSLQALAESTGRAIRVFAQPAWLDLLDRERFARASIDRREIADLFASAPLREETRRLFAATSLVHSWTGHGDERFATRLASAAGGEVRIHPFRGMVAGEHAADYFARCLDVRPVMRPLLSPPDAEQWVDDFWRRHALGTRALAIHGGSGSAQKNWEGMSAIAQLWRDERGGRVLLLTGPAEEEPTPRDVAFDAAVHNERLDRVAALLRRAHLYVGNDSGISHLASLAGARGLALFGPTDPRTWRPLGPGLAVLHAPTPCSACGPERFCTHRLPVKQVHEAVVA